MTGVKRTVMTLIFGTIIALSGRALAQPSSTDIVLAETLYREGRELLAEEKYAEACAKFAESHRLDPATGTLLNLAACNEVLGKLASAWLQFNEARHMARRDNREDRVKYAEEHLAAIEPRLSHLVVDVPQAADVEGLEVRVDGVLIGVAARGVRMPVDPGEHEIAAEAPGRRPWTQTIEMTQTGALLRIEIPVLEPLREKSEKPQKPHAASGDSRIRPADAPDRDVDRIRPIPLSVYVAGGATLALGVGAAASSFVYLDRKETYDSLRMSGDAAAADARKTATTWGVVNLALTGAATAGAALTCYFYLTRPEQPLRRSLSVVPFADGKVAGLAASGRF